ncbi:hypothetical protein QPM17_22715 [Marinobacter sp. TBZ242]|uniref:Holin of 3TMs, for gene-transfer release n=1 Tax=Marinobacter azerbaijanicus TaxID=3050455 RepID=A0ABT7IIF4_9GAMM|nr:hypothetical protein [Marinobacter sp. TBZ242]MDL0433957.1 hypothetical protein [Marinobacter sp. TBZ242]
MIGAIPIIGDLIGLGKTWIQGKQKRSQAKADAEAAVMVSSATSRQEWEKLQAQASANSWKDEYWTLVLSIPAIMCFFPQGVDAATAGFAALDTMPEYYRYFLGVAITASFGIKGYKSWKAGK